MWLTNICRVFSMITFWHRTGQTLYNVKLSQCVLPRSLQPKPTALKCSLHLKEISTEYLICSWGKGRHSDILVWYLVSRDRSGTRKTRLLRLSLSRYNNTQRTALDCYLINIQKALKNYWVYGREGRVAGLDSWGPDHDKGPGKMF